MGAIFLVDDQPITNFITRKLLEVQGVKSTVRDFTNPLEALEELKKDQNTFIFLDLNMPEMSGWEFMDQLKLLNLNPKIVILTSSTSDIDKKRARDYSFVIDFMSKPLNKIKFSSLIQKLKKAI